MRVMEDKVKKYVWIAACCAIAFTLLGIKIYIGDFFNTGALSSILNAYIFLFITALIYELKLNKTLFYVMLSISLLMFVYGHFIASWF